MQMFIFQIKNVPSIFRPIKIKVLDLFAPKTVLLTCTLVMLMMVFLIQAKLLYYLASMTIIKKLKKRNSSNTRPNGHGHGHGHGNGPNKRPRLRFLNRSDENLEDLYSDDVLPPPSEKEIPPLEYPPCTPEEEEEIRKMFKKKKI